MADSSVVVGDADALSEATRDRVLTGKRVVQSLVSTAVVVGIFVGVMPRIASYGDVWDTIRAMTGLELLGLFLVGIWNLVTYWFVLIAALPGLRLREAAVVNQASTAVSNTLPGGGAIGVGVALAVLRSWGFRVSAITRSALVTGIWNNFVKLGMPVVALALLAFEGGATVARAIAALIGIAVLIGSVVGFGLVLRSESAAERVGQFFGRLVDRARGLARRRPLGSWAQRAVTFRRDTIGLLQNRWFSLTLASLVSHISLYIVLLVALRNVGIGQNILTWIEVLAAFSFVRLVSALPVTPGGVGVVELGYAAVMTIGMDSASAAKVVAAILLFRAITYVLPVPFGAASYMVWRGNQSWRMDERERDSALATRTPRSRYSSPSRSEGSSC
ncbi:MAG: flippase-like domain-containing protein [Acidimicrobiia bacterium]|nr:flippase-like domain-containing protein [Acidimicrobiia bacterium]